jgi:hypothetical protein
MRKWASMGSLVLGVLLIVGALFTWFTVSSTLGDQQITVADDASCLAGNDVNGPFSAYCEAQIIEHHALDATDGLTYAQMDRDDPRRATAMNASFLRASLFTSVVAFGVAAMAGGMGVVFILLGLGMRDVSENLVPTRT